jgi:hypothetical protein
MTGTTKNYGLVKPTVGGSENEWGGNLNDDLDDIDKLLGGDLPVNGINIESGTIDGGAITGEIGNGDSENPTTINPETVISGKVKELIGLKDPDGVIKECDIEARNLTVVNGVTETQYTFGSGNNADVLGSKSSVQYMPIVDPAQTIKLTMDYGQSVTLVLNWTDANNPPAISWEPQSASLLWVGGGSPNINAGKNVIQLWCMDFGTGKTICGAYTGVVS